MKRFFITLIFLMISLHAVAERTYVPIDTCYHWFEPQYFEAKIKYAEENDGKMFFEQNEVVYCWRSPLGAQSNWEDHGDLLMRIKFKPKVKIAHHARMGSISGTLSIAEILYSNDNYWHEYTITPDAVESWSINHPNLIAELKADYAYHTSGRLTENDVFYPFNNFDLTWLQNIVPIIIENHVQHADETLVYGDHLERHFQTRYTLPWQASLDRNKFIPVRADLVALRAVEKTRLIEVVSASYGLNLTAANQDNATRAAKDYCDGKKTCGYKVSPKFLVDPAPDKEKDFHISYRCGPNDTDIKTHSVPSPADEVVFELSCRKT